MNRRTRHIVIATLLVGTVFTAAAEAGVNLSISYRPGPFSRRSGGTASPSVSSGTRQAMSSAQSELTKAYAAAARADPLSEEIKGAQDAVTKARKDYALTLAAAREVVAKEPNIAALRAEMRSAEQRLAEEQDATIRLSIARELMSARNKLNAAEGDLMGIDPDLAVAKAAVAEATETLKTLQARRQQQLHQDPAVLAARERLNGLRRQLVRR
ncbi:MAG TPA: hypothetical protein VF595_15075 [Tepidisphaeraceae bacterium]